MKLSFGKNCLNVIDASLLIPYHFIVVSVFHFLFSMYKMYYLFKEFKEFKLLFLDQMVFFFHAM